MAITMCALKIPELLAPAGNLEKLMTAIHYGADAVYCGGKKYSLRAHAANFSESGLREAVAYAHARSVKIYVTVNIVAREDDLPGLGEYLLFLRDIGVDGIIVADPGVLSLAGQLTPELPVHFSTQANVTNSSCAAFWQRQGVSRLNLARELGIREISAIKKSLSMVDRDTEVEVFVHGAVCISYSGRCLLSYYLTGRDANQGDCAQPCRYRYNLLEEKRPGQYFPVEEDERGTYIFNSKDLCLIDRLPRLLEAGVDCLKIEGRMKSVYYVGGVVRVYRAALDYLAGLMAAGLESGDCLPDAMPPAYMEELTRIGTRGYTEGFAGRKPTGEDMLYDAPRAEQQYVPVGLIRRLRSGSVVEIEVRSPIRTGECLEYLGQGLEVVTFGVLELENIDGERLGRVHPGTVALLKTDQAVDSWRVNGLIRKKL